MIRRISERLKRHGWFGVAIDLVVVVVGILIALQLDGWAERRGERRLENVYLQRLIEDLQIERDGIEAAERYARDRIADVRFLDSVAADPEAAAAQPDRFAEAIETATWRSFPQINEFVYRELQSTGRLSLLRSEALRRSLADHYTKLQHDARVGEDLSAQQRFDAAVAGLLTIPELEAVELDQELQVSPARAVALARAFSQLTAAVAELPSLVQHHTFNLARISEMKSRSNDIIEQIGSLTSAKAGRPIGAAGP